MRFADIQAVTAQRSSVSNPKRRSIMNPIPRRAALGAATATMLVRPVLAQGGSTCPVTIIVPFSAGNPPDLVAGLITDGMARCTGQPRVVDTPE